MSIADPTIEGRERARAVADLHDLVTHAVSEIGVLASALDTAEPPYPQASALRIALPLGEPAS